MSVATLGLALLAGILSVLSPCVLPLLPIVLGTAASEHRLGPVALAIGLAISFVAIGIFVATIGFAIGLDTDFFRLFAGVLLVLIGLVLVVPRLQEAVATAASPVSAWASSRFGGGPVSGLSGQFGVGLLLGAVWSPCVGPTLGAAAVLASQGKDLGQVAATMLAFGIGAALPLLVLGMLSRQMMLNLRGRLMSAGGPLKAALGVLLVLVGVLVVTGLDKRAEAAIVEASPEWLVQLTTRF
jgi:cytochrome c biogenesis protein CcdA